MGPTGQLREASSRALRDLAVLLDRPSMLEAELGGARLGGSQLGREDHSLISRELARGASDLAYFLAHDDIALDVGAAVDYRDAVVASCERQRGLERRLHRAAAADRASAISDARVEAQLERIAEMPVVRICATSANVHDELEHGLAIAILEILAPESMAIEMEEQGALRERDHRDRFRRVSGEGRARTACSARDRSAASARHTPMSFARSIRPPLNFVARRARG